MGRIGSEVRVSASFQIFALRMLLHYARVGLGGFSARGNIRGSVNQQSLRTSYDHRAYSQTVIYAN